MPGNYQSTRCKFFKQTNLPGTGVFIGLNSFYSDKANKPKLEQYGGWAEKKLTKIGYFNTEHDGNCLWFGTQDGSCFSSFGINNRVLDSFNRDFHKEGMQKFFGLIDLSGENPDYPWASKNCAYKLVKTLKKTCTILYQKLSTTKLMITIITINQLSLNL